ncbi:unnamed protein product, partial [Mesorhabditis belari]|uniref:Uncharacterized protein n=1 Tax=Mesorhabditis belari TaxID=2138241 RepID=A0AAF3EXA4_9BILA
MQIATNQLNVTKILLFFFQFVFGRQCPDGSIQEDCDRYKCDTGPGIHHAPTEYFSRPGRSVFSHPCRCLPDWNAIFCNQTQALFSLPPNSHINVPTVCICRKFTDSSNCQQFITRCFKRKNGCDCCFNQPDEYCNHVKCSDGKPDFEGSNTTCVCHSNPVDYPMHICGLGQNQISTSKFYRQFEGSKSFFSMNGYSVSSNLAVLLIISTLIIVCVLAVVMVINGQRKQKMARERREEAQHGASDTLETLLPQKKSNNNENSFLS